MMRPVALAVMLVAVLGCAKGGSGGVLLVEPETIGKGCEAWSQPKALPAASELLRTEMLQPMLAARGGTLLVSLRFDQSGKPDRLAPLGGTMPDSLRPGLITAVRAAVVPDQRYASGSLRLLFNGTAPIMIGRSEYCPPVILSGASGAGEVAVDMPADQAPNLQAPRFSVLVTSAGTIGQSKLLASSGNRQIDDGVARSFPNWRLKPAVLDGAKISAWMDVPR